MKTACRFGNALELGPNPLPHQLGIGHCTPRQFHCFISMKQLFNVARALLGFFRRAALGAEESMASRLVLRIQERYQRLTAGEQKLARLIMDGQDDTLTVFGNRAG